MIRGVRASSIRIEFDFVDDGVEVTALDHVLQTVLHVVAQIVEAVFVVGAVGDVAAIGCLALGIVETVDDHPGGQAEETVDLAHPCGVAPGEVVVDGDDMHALAGQRIEVDCKGCDQRLALAGLHLGDVALMQHHATDQLHIEMPLTQRSLRRLADGCKRRNQNVVERLAVSKLLTELRGAGFQPFVGKRRQFRLQGIDGIDAGLISLDPPVVGGTEKLAGERADHANSCPSRSARAAVGWSTSGVDLTFATCQAASS